MSFAVCKGKVKARSDEKKGGAAAAAAKKKRDAAAKSRAARRRNADLDFIKGLADVHLLVD